MLVSAHVIHPLSLTQQPTNAKIAQMVAANVPLQQTAHNVNLLSIIIIRSVTQHVLLLLISILPVTHVLLATRIALIVPAVNVQDVRAATLFIKTNV